MPGSEATMNRLCDGCCRYEATVVLQEGAEPVICRLCAELPEGEPFNRNFHDDGAGLSCTNLLKQGTYAVIKIGGDDE